MKKVSTLLIVLLFCRVLLSQSYTNDLLKIPDYIPKSPEVTAFAKYGDIPVSEYTGTANISIPIYIVKSGGLSLPINLSYHPSGIQVSQEATWVGLGWNLIAGGAIIYAPVGGNDQINTLNLSWTDRNKLLTYLKNTGNANSLGADDPMLGWSGLPVPTIPAGGYQISEQALLKGTLGQGEPDIYNVIFLNYSFKFFIHPKDGTPVFVGKNNNKCSIKTISNNYNHLSGFIITGEDGIKYYFKDIEWSNIGGNYVANQWNLSRVESLDGHYINLNYHNSGSIKQIPTLSERYGVDFPQAVHSQNGKKRQLNAVGSEINNLYLTSIETNSEIVSFCTDSSRVDLSGKSKRLIAIKVIDKIGNIEIMRDSLKYDYFVGCNVGGDYTKDDNFNSANTADDILRKRLKLTKLIRYDAYSTQGEKYNFTYNESVQLPLKTSFARDYWGYYNGQENSSTLMPNSAQHTLIPNALDLYENGYMNFDNYDPIPDEWKSMQGGANRGASTVNSIGWMLKSIQYPTGGSTKFEFEPHTFSNQTYISAEDRNNLYKNTNVNISSYISTGGGVRLKTITNYDANNNAVLTKKFIYKGGLMLTPIKFIDTKRVRGGITLVSSGWNTLSFEDKITKILSSDNFNPPASAGSGISIGYDQVEIATVSGNNTNGKEIIYFKNKPANNLASQSNFTLYDNCFTNGDVIKQIYLNASNDTIHTEENKYNQLETYNEFINYKTFDIFVGPEDSRFFFYPRFFILAYSNTSLWSFLQSKITTDYFNGSKIIKSTNYLYNPNNYQIKEIDEMQSDGHQKRTVLQYPHDFPSTSPCDTMIARNIISPVIMNSAYKDGTFLESIKTNYSYVTPGGVIKPSSIVSQIGNYIPKIRLQYAQYDFVSYNPVYLIQNEAINMVYLWSYNNTYPVAKIEGLAYSDVVTALTQNFIYNLSVTAIPTIDQLNTIRTQLTTKTALVTTFTYKPLVGTVTATDPRGVTTNYTYDTFNRLYLIRNDDQNVLAQYRYGYQNTPDNGLGGYVAPMGTIATGASSYSLNSVYTATFNIAAGSGSYTYSWSLLNSSGTVLQTGTSSSFNYTCSQAGIITLKCVIVDTQSGLSSTYTVPIIVNPQTGYFVMKNGYLNTASNLVNYGNYVSFYLVFFSCYSSISNYQTTLIANISANCRSTSYKSFTYSSGGRIWSVSVSTNGDVSVTLVGGPVLPASTSASLGTLTY